MVSEVLISVMHFGWVVVMDPMREPIPEFRISTFMSASCGLSLQG